VPSSVLGADAASNRIGVGLIGCGKPEHDRSAGLLGARRLPGAGRLRREYRQPRLQDARAVSRPQGGPGEGQCPLCRPEGIGGLSGLRCYNDFREVLARKDIDAVVIIVPDHWHGLMVVMAARAQGHLLRKPLSLTIGQGQAMDRAVREHKRILQTGSHYRSSPAMRRACELVRNGRIGQVKRVHAQVAESSGRSRPGWQPMPVPEGLDYELWLGPAPAARITRTAALSLPIHTGLLRRAGDHFGAHSNDIAQLAWAPTIPAQSRSRPGLRVAAQGWALHHGHQDRLPRPYANGAGADLQDDKPGFGTRFEGTEGWVEYGYRGLRRTRSRGHLADRSQRGPPAVSNPKRPRNRPQSHPDHARNFLDCIRSRREPVRGERGHRTATVCHLGNIAMMLKRKLTWDPVKEQFSGDDEATVC